MSVSLKMNMKKPITVQVAVDAPIAKVWEYWNEPEHIGGWAFAQDDWEAVDIENDVRGGGKFKTRMQAKDGSQGFDFTGTYSVVREHELIEYDMEDGRHVKVEFKETPKGMQVIETFDPESENPEKVQKSGWQAILNNFKKYAEENA